MSDLPELAKWGDFETLAASPLRTILAEPA